MRVGDRVKRTGLDGPVPPVGEVVKVFRGFGVGIVRVRWQENGDYDGHLRESLEATASLEVVDAR